MASSSVYASKSARSMMMYCMNLPYLPPHSLLSSSYNTEAPVNRKVSGDLWGFDLQGRNVTHRESLLVLIEVRLLDELQLGFVPLAQDLGEQVVVSSEALASQVDHLRISLEDVSLEPVLPNHNPQQSQTTRS